MAARTNPFLKAASLLQKARHDPGLNKKYLSIKMGDESHRV
jgi:hypothetical protein